MKKTQFIPIALLSVSAVANAQSASRPPNIILFLVDDMGWEDTSYLFGSKRRIIMRYMRPRTWSDWRKGA